MKTPSTFNWAWSKACIEVFNNGIESKPRGQEVIELLNFSLEFDMKYPIITSKARNLGYRFLFAEAWWIISGRNDVKSIAPYSRAISNFSDDSEWFQGAYGPKIINQLSYVIGTLAKDQNSRQAVLTIWEPNPRASKDHSCTVSVQWMIRDGKIHCFDNMRSSDIWLGLPYDGFNFTMLTAFIALALRSLHSITVELGTFHLQSSNEHIYSRNLGGINDVILENIEEPAYPPLSLDKFDDHWDLLNYLERAKDHNFIDTDWASDFIIANGSKAERKGNWYGAD